jgi:hypothetical protein
VRGSFFNWKPGRHGAGKNKKKEKEEDEEK